MNNIPVNLICKRFASIREVKRKKQKQGLHTVFLGQLSVDIDKQFIKEKAL